MFKTFDILSFGIWDLFGFWDLCFGIYASCVYCIPGTTLIQLKLVGTV